LLCQSITVCKAVLVDMRRKFSNLWEDIENQNLILMVRPNSNQWKINHLISQIFLLKMKFKHNLIPKKSTYNMRFALQLYIMKLSFLWSTWIFQRTSFTIHIWLVKWVFPFTIYIKAPPGMKIWWKPRWVLNISLLNIGQKIEE